MLPNNPVGLGLEFSHSENKEKSPGTETKFIQECAVDKRQSWCLFYEPVPLNLVFVVKGRELQ